MFQITLTAYIIYGINVAIHLSPIDIKLDPMRALPGEIVYTALNPNGQCVIHYNGLSVDHLSWKVTV
jgi:hypothetical protein